MNKTQRAAWFTLGVSTLLIIFGALIFTSMLTPGDRTAGVRLVKVWAWLIPAFLAGGVAFVHWKRRTPELDCDERDNGIKKNAVLVAFISLWLLLIAASIILSCVTGGQGSILVCLLPVINIGVFIIVMVVYSVTVLIQYGWTGKGEKFYD